MRTFFSMVSSCLFVATSCVVTRSGMPSFGFQLPAAQTNVAVASPPPSQPVAMTPATQPPPGTCVATISVGTVQTRPGCQIDTRVSSRTTTVNFPCNGGNATASFGDAVFTGTITPDGTAQLSLRTTFPYRDGCTWETKQEIAGSLASGTLSYSYNERPLANQNGCAPGCSAQASVRATR
jgi:hypothetical protein